MDRCRHELAPFVEAFRAGTLPREVWSHEAHLLVAWVLLGQSGDVDATVDELRALIGEYNRRTGMPPERVECHATLTRYYVEAIAARAPATVAELLAEPSCSRRAPARHWSPARLASVAARRGWQPPDRAPLPWRASEPSADPSVPPDPADPTDPPEPTDTGGDR